jgi:hypothetical protein
MSKQKLEKQCSLSLFQVQLKGIVSRDEIFILRVLKNQLSTVVCMSADGFHNVWLPIGGPVQ